MKIGSFDFDSGSTFIIAELSGNHNGDINLAKETIRAAKRSGADCIKLQTYTADTITLDVRSDLFKAQKGSAWDGQYLYDLYKKAYTPWEWHRELFDVAHQEGLIIFSSPFDFTAVDLLEELNVPAYKIASYEITDIPLIDYVARKGKPVIFSSGIADKNDIDLAIKTCRDAGNDQIVVLQCTSSYPSPPEDANLITIPEITNKWNVLSGLSDHTMGIEAPVVAVALGARVIEKHFILSRDLGGVDSHFSLNESEFSAMVEAVRRAEKMLGHVALDLDPKKIENRRFSRSLFVSEDVKKGETITPKNVRSVRPGVGLHPKYFTEILGKKFNQDLAKGTPLKLDFLE